MCVVLAPIFFLISSIWNKSPKEREMEEDTNKRDPWPTHLFACCSGFKNFFSFFFSLSFLKERKKERCVVVMSMMMKSKYIPHSFHSFKIHFFFFSFFFCFFEKGGISLCLWGFLCPICLQRQGYNHAKELSETSSENEMIESRFERYPPWSCRGFNGSDLAVGFFFGCCFCFYGVCKTLERF